MTISVHDERLVAGKQKTLEALEACEFEDARAEEAANVACAILEDSIEEYEDAIRREDLTDEVREALQEPRGRTAEALVRVYYTLKRQYAERRARGEELTEEERELEEFLRNLSPTEYITASFPNAMSALEKAIDFASQNLPEDLAKLSETALERAREAREQLEELGDRALRVYSDLEQAREEAKSRYLAVRELTSAALRLEDRYGELNEIAPPISDVMSPE